MKICTTKTRRCDEEGERWGPGIPAIKVLCRRDKLFIALSPARWAEGSAHLAAH